MILQSWKLSEDIVISHLDKFDHRIHELVKKNFDHIYPILKWREYLNENSTKKLNDLNSNLENRNRIDVGVFHNEELIGWSYGWQGGMESGTYYMANSCILPEFRRKGLYSKLLDTVIEISKKTGYQTITSRHVSGNNPVIIAKLKAGFKITGFEMSEIHGHLIHLTYFHNKLRGEAFDVRSGMIKPKTDLVKNLYL